jgi:hypothetical protein
MIVTRAANGFSISSMLDNFELFLGGVFEFMEIFLIFGLLLSSRHDVIFCVQGFLPTPQSSSS